MVVKFIKRIMKNVFFVTDVYVRKINFMCVILHLNVNQLSVICVLVTTDLAGLRWVFSDRYVCFAHVWYKCEFPFFSFLLHCKLILYFSRLMTAVDVGLAGRRRWWSPGRESVMTVAPLFASLPASHIPPPPSHPSPWAPFSFCHGVSKNDSYGYARARASAKTQQPETHLPPSTLARSRPLSTTTHPSRSRLPTTRWSVDLQCNSGCLVDHFMQGLVTLPANSLLSARKHWWSSVSPVSARFPSIFACSWLLALQGALPGPAWQPRL